jgi:biotin operon repressor
VLDRKFSPKIPVAIARLEGEPHNVRADARRNMERMITDLAFFADKNGFVQVAQETLAKIMGVSRGAVRNNLDKLREHGFIRTDQLRGGEWVETGDIRFAPGYVDSEGDYWYGPEQFAYKTRVWVATSLRCKDLDPTPLGKLAEAKNKKPHGRSYEWRRSA